MLEFDSIIVSGASGAVGTYLVKELLRTTTLPVICLLRNKRSMEKLSRALGPDLIDQLQVVYADLTTQNEMVAASSQIGRRSRSLLIHCAAEISWTKSERLAAPINVTGTRLAVDLTLHVSDKKPGIIFLSTAFCSENEEPRNQYEKTKREAERLLVGEFGSRASIAVLKCSLIVGASDTGWISRFNGLYPLVRILALAEVPCLIADPEYKVDIIPVDFVVRQILLTSQRLSDDEPVLRLIAASGEKAIALKDVASIVVSRVDDARRSHGLSAMPDISILAERQFRFLMSASKSWDLSERFAKVEEISEIMAGYIEHGGSGREIEAVVIDDEVPDPADYLPAVIDYWVDCNQRRVLRQEEPGWLKPRSDAVA